MTTVIELLEARIAPSTLALINSYLATYSDAENQLVSVRFSKPILTVENFPKVLVTVTAGLGETLQKIDLAAVAPAASGGPAQGTSITLTVKTDVAHPGDGLADVGFINAPGIDLGAISIAGDLGRILAGDDNHATKGLLSLKAASMGARGLASQGGTGDLSSFIKGPAGNVVIDGSMTGASLYVTDQEDLRNTIGSIKLGALIGTTAASSATIYATGSIGAITVLGDVQGAGGNDSGRIISQHGRIASVTIGGQLHGGAGLRSGQIFSGTDMGPVKIHGGITGGTASDSGEIYSPGKMGAVTLDGDLRGGGATSTDMRAGYIRSGGDMGTVKITGNLQGGPASYSGGIISDGKMGGLTITGSLIGGGADNTASYSGFVISGKKLGAVKIGAGIQGGVAGESGYIQSLSGTASFTLTGDLAGNDGFSSASVIAGNVGPVRITGRIVGAAGAFSGSFVANNIAALTVTGDVTGGSGTFSGGIAGLNIGAVKIGGNLKGGAGSNTGEFSFDHAGPVSVGDGTPGAGVIGGAGRESGEIVGNQTPSLTIHGDVKGGSDIFAGELTIFNPTRIVIEGSLLGGSNVPGKELHDTGAILIGGSVGSIVVHGSIVAGTYAGPDPTGAGAVTFLNNGAIRATGSIGSLTVDGDITGNYSAPMAVIKDSSGDVIVRTNSNVLITAGGVLDTSQRPPPRSDTALGTLTVHGYVKFAHILGGYGREGTGLGGDGATNADAGIVKLVVDHDWTSSTLATGVKSGDPATGKQAEGFATADDSRSAGADVQDLASIVSKIGSVLIRGNVLAATDPSNPSNVLGSSGFAAEWIVSLSAHNIPALALQAHEHNDFTAAPNKLAQSAAPIVALHEVG